ncbi:MAG: NifB/NifX family molybdenum-iron cluster-binding protein [Granulosicoccaceae bacterium]|jgi:predicted Fe-Mo cluster-binding NifX family protein
MKIAIAAMTPDLDARIAKHSARAPYYLLFDEQGEMLEVVSNPFADDDRGIAPRVARLLADKGATLLVAGEFGPRFVSELEERGIDRLQRSGQVADSVRQFIA